MYKGYGFVTFPLLDIPAFKLEGLLLCCLHYKKLEGLQVFLLSVLLITAIILLEEEEFHIYVVFSIVVQVVVYSGSPDTREKIYEEQVREHVHHMDA